jgi:hypothetical protein
MTVNITITGYSDVQNAIKSIQRAFEGALSEIVLIGALPIENEAKLLAPVDTGALRDSINSRIISSSSTRALAGVGPHVPYGARIEFGFVGADSRGRHYNQGPQPYLRPAFENKKREAYDEMEAASREVLNNAIDEEANSRAAARRRRG